jgi:uncharacterized protein YukE
MLPMMPQTTQEMAEQVDEAAERGEKTTKQEKDRVTERWSRAAADGFRDMQLSSASGSSLQLPVGSSSP